MALRSTGTWSVARAAARSSAPPPSRTSGAGTSARPAVTTAAPPAISANGSARPNPSARTPATGGPARWARPPTTIEMPSARWPALSATSVVPAVQTAAKATPKITRPASSTSNEGARACTTAEAAISAPASTQTKRAPRRAQSTPAGSAAATVASVEAASTAPVRASERANWSANPGSSGKSIDCPSSVQKTRA